MGGRFYGRGYCRVQIAVACACLGLILETMTGTGIGMKLPDLLRHGAAAT
jgi:TRAP-type uncharacterized transport system fused permease subunit